MQFSTGEKLLLLWLSMNGEHEHEFGRQNVMDYAFVADAIASGHTWAIERKYPWIFSTKEVAVDVRNEVLNFLDMWLAIEEACRDDLGDEAVDIGLDRPLALNSVEFDGFFLPEESEHLYTASFIIRNFAEYDAFKGRNLNAKSARLDGNRRMWRVFEPLRAGLVEGVKLDAEQLRQILKEIVHPDNRSRP
jgi:uncharacterized protein